MEPCLTQHARDRLAERTTLSENEFFSLLQRGRSVIVGIESYSNRLHKLIYSEPDKDHFVAIQDVSNGEVITILPLKYHENLTRKISKKALRKAIYKAAPDIFQKLYIKNLPPAPGIKVNMIIVTRSSCMKIHRRSFGTHRFDPCPENAREALNNKEFSEKIIHRIAERQIDINQIDELLLFNNDSDLLITIPWLMLTSLPLKTAPLDA